MLDVNLQTKDGLNTNILADEITRRHLNIFSIRWSCTPRIVAVFIYARCFL